MRLHLLGLSVLLAACGSDSDGDAPSDDTDDPSDGHGNDTDGVDTDRPTNPMPNPETTGDSEMCVLLFGGNDRIRGPDEGFPVLDAPRTLQAWIRTAYTGEQIAVSYGRPSPQQGFLLGTVDGYALVRAGSGTQRVVGSVFVADDKWHHLAASFDGVTVVLLVDGETDEVERLHVESLEGDFVAGNTPTGDLTAPWIGWLDDIRLFDHNRTVEEVGADLDGLSVDPGALLLHWDFELDPESMGLGLMVPDASGHGNVGETGGSEATPLFLPCR